MKDKRRIVLNKVRKRLRRKKRLSKLERQRRNKKRLSVFYPYNSYEVYQKKVVNRRKNIVPCSNFELLKNPNDVIQFISELKALKGNNRIIEIVIDLKDIKTIDEPAISLMLSSVHELSLNKKRVRGSIPEDESAYEILTRSGFFTNIKKVSDNISKKIKSNNSKNILLIADHTTKKKGQVIGEFIKKAMKVLTGIEEHNRALYTFIIEMNLNAFEHAYETIEDFTDKHWVLGFSYNEEEEKLYFTFTDNGVGILNQLNIKKPLLFKQILVDFNFNQELLLINLFDKKYNSRFKTQINRNRGLPAIKEKYVNNDVNNLICLSNNVLLNFNGDETLKLKHEFMGTFYYWEMDLNNLKH
ncbi:hypothetical protein [Myroides odoratus]|uniref:hypothetical protein n=1 Tax=Myroides odoratus TaxID=256 RepID=UPI00333F0B2D